MSGQVISQLKASCLRLGDQPALVSSRGSTTYRQLWANGQHALEHLRAAGVQEGSRVGLRTDDAARVIVWAIALQQLRASYVPLSDGDPADVTAQKVRDAGVAWTVDGDYAATPCVRRATGQSGFGPDVSVSPDELGVLYTSGTTGTAKGIKVSDASTARLLEWFSSVKGVEQPHSTLLMLLPEFEPWGFVVYSALIRGDVLVVPDLGERHSPAALSRLLLQNGVSEITCVPSQLDLLLPSLQTNPGMVADLFVGGDIIPREVERRVHETGCRLHRLYGPTENSAVSTMCSDAHSRSLGHSEACIGFPLPGVRCRIDVGCDIDNPAPDLDVGELVVGGDLLSLGYVKDAGRGGFTTDDDGTRWYSTGDTVRTLPDLSYEFLTRGDTLVKVRDARVDLSLVRGALRRTASGRASAVVLVGTGASATLVGVVECADGNFDSDAAHTALVNSLPRSHRPHRLVLLPKLPTLPSGKVDYGRLQIDLARQSNGTASEQIAVVDIAAIWSDLLGEEVSSQADLFDLGLDSFTALVGLSRLNKLASVSYEFEDLVSMRTPVGIWRSLVGIRAPAPAKPESDDG